ncbi:MAG: DUF3300 domain-containing protein [Opitutaceae bacterium]|nr:DUF3300 domain-containing protein [Opitutaceae bacterium]
MKTLCALLALLTLTSGMARAQDAATGAITAETRRSPAELEKLLAPIALYPDALIAIILPASTAPADVVLAARQLRDHPGDPSQVEHRAWDESVKSLTHYPAVLAWMDENLAWTKQVGEAFAAQPAEVMQAMQRLRAQARAAGTLVDTPQQQVIAEAEVIRIVPAQPDVIYVPYYEPEVVFVSRPYVGYVHPRPFFTFGVGVRVGSWLAFECDWRRHTIWVGNRHRAWHGHDWRRPLVVAPPIGSAYVRTPEVRHWRPSPQVVRPSAPSFTAPRVTPLVARPTPFAQIESRSAHFSRPAGFTPRPSEPDRTVGQRRSRPDATAGQASAPAARVTTPALPAQPALAPTVPPSPSVPPPASDRLRDNRGRTSPPRSHPPAVATAAPTTAASATIPTPPPAQHQNVHRRSQPPAVVALPTPPAANSPTPALGARPDYRGHSRSAPAVAPTPPVSTPAPAATAPANPPPRPERHGDRRGGRSGDPER